MNDGSEDRPDYADRFCPLTPAEQQALTEVGITQTSA